jgi:hypothetical protein
MAIKDCTRRQSARASIVRPVLLRTKGDEGAFSDPRVMLHFVGDPGFWGDEDEVMLRQTWDGPAHLMIGRDTSDEDLQRAARRLAVDFDELRAFREVARALKAMRKRL